MLNGHSMRLSSFKVIHFGAVPTTTYASYPAPHKSEHRTIEKSRESPAYHARTLDGAGHTEENLSGSSSSSYSR